MTDQRRREGLGSLRPAADLYGDVVTAYVDVSRTGPQGASDVERRTRNLADALAEAGAEQGLVDRVCARLVEETGHGGEVSRAVVAQGDRLVTDVMLAGVVEPHAHHGPIAHLLGLARTLSHNVRYAVVVLDHTGADITLADTAGLAEVSLESEGDHDVLHKYGGGGWSHRRFQSRVEDSIERNTDHVARDLERIVKREDPDLVLLAGDAYSCGHMKEAVAPHVAERLEVLDHGSRAEGASEERMDEDVAAAVERCRTRSLDAVLDRLGVAEGRKAVGVGETVEALRRGQVETLILLDGALDGREAAVGPEPLHLGHTADEVRALGVEDPATDRLDEVLLRAALGQDADLLALHAPISALPDGVGAVLRFDTRSA